MGNLGAKRCYREAEEYRREAAKADGPRDREYWLKLAAERTKLAQDTEAKAARDGRSNPKAKLIC